MACHRLHTLGMTILALSVLGLGNGCLAHRSTLTPPVAAAPPVAGEAAAITRLVAGTRTIAEPTMVVEERSALPIDLPVSAWRRDGDGTLSRGELRLRTPLPWWQRFPADAPVDLLPVEAEVHAGDTVVLAPVPEIDRERLFAEAARDGYARRVAARTSAP